jgi:predicted CXXCH cytochrome family protein
LKAEHRQSHRRVILSVLAVAAISILTAALLPLAAAAQDNPPPVPHPIEGRETCSACHAPDGGIYPAPENHASFADTLCLECHEQVTAPAIPHETAEKPDCLLCHALDSVLPAPANHADYTVSQCLGCHEATGVTTPDIPHDTAGRQDCLACHGPDAFLPEPENHAGYQEVICLLCHAVNVNASTEPGGGTPRPITSDSCMSCHGQPDMTMTLDDSSELSLYVDPSVWMSSVHGDKLLCTDCHTNITTYPHETWDIPSRRDYSISQYDLCRRCHFDNYTKTLDSIHYKIFSEGNQNTPLCTDCHGAHDIIALSQDRRKISQTCSQCHQGIYDQYISSVHGNALLTEDNYDVPVCTDCHTSHTIVDPTTASFRLESVQLCANCHSNAELMKKYGISPNVVKSYLADFHGRTVALIEKEDKDIWVQEAVCTDCHGIHDIQAVDNPDSPVIKANLAVTCGKCHDDVSTNFSGAWLSHYEVTFKKLPAIFLVNWFYKILIPFILVGLSIHVLLDLWRRITNR